MSKKIKSDLQVATPVVPYTQCIAKTISVEDPKNKVKERYPGMTVEEHCIMVGYVFQALVKLFRLSKVIPKGAELIAALHDVGKISIGFQRRISKGCSILMQAYRDLFQDPHTYCEFHQVMGDASIREILSSHQSVNSYAYIVGVHHGWYEHPLKEGCLDYGSSEWATERRRLVKSLMKRFGEPPTKITTIEIRDMCAALVSLADWIASDEHFYDQTGGFSSKKILARTSKVIQGLGWRRSCVKRNNGKALTFSQMFGHKYKRNHMQTLVSRMIRMPGVYLIEASTGMGKTEAALEAAYRLLEKGFHRGIFFALPTRVTSDSMYERVISWMEKTHESGMAPKLIHGLSFLRDKEVDLPGEFTFASKWFTTNRKALLTPFGVGTLDQLLLGVLNVRYNFIRTFGLYNKIVILDEVHSYDVYTGRLLDILIEKLRALNCTVIMLSATLTHDRKRQLFNIGENDPHFPKISSYPLVTALREGKPIRCRTRPSDEHRKVVINMTANLDKAFTEAIKRANAGQQVIWFCNLVNKAVAVYKAIEGKVPECGLMHSRFIPGWRKAREDYWLKALGKHGDRSIGRILVVTQVGEQSIDIDADFMITDLAPSDMLLQRLGRLWRHKHIDHLCGHAEAWILTEDLCKPKSKPELLSALGLHGMIYNPFVLYRTYCEWAKRKVVRIPFDIRRILERTYRDCAAKEPEWVQVLYSDVEAQRYAYKHLAEFNAGDQKKMDDEPEGMFFDLDISEDESSDLPPQTRVGRLPYVPLVLLKGLTVTDDIVTMHFIDDVVYSFNPNGERCERFKATAEVYKRVVMVPTCKSLRKHGQPIAGPEWLYKLMNKSHIPAIVSSTGAISTYEGIPTPYLVTPTLGVHKEVELV